MVPLGYELKDRKLLIVENEAELVRAIFRRYLELGSINRLVVDLKEKNFRTKIRKLSTGNVSGGIPFTQGPLFYMLRNRFYVGEVRFKNEILPGSQPALMDRALFDAVQTKLTEQWSHRTVARTNSAAPLARALQFSRFAMTVTSLVVQAMISSSQSAKNSNSSWFFEILCQK
jgi:site-specific DNA recombinase